MQTMIRTAAACLMALVVSVAYAQTPGTCSVRDPDLQGSYEGDCIGGMASGKGRAVGKDRYEGGFRDGYMTGYGVYSKASGQRFEGEFVEGKLNGCAKVYNVGGNILEGQFTDNRLVGIGRMTSKSGEVAEVELRDGKIVPVAKSAGSISPAATPFPTGTATTAVKWAPRLDLEDLFPSYILATATRAAPRQAPSNYRGDPWGLVGIQVRTTEPNATVGVMVTVDEIAEPTKVQFTLDAPGDYLLYPKLRYRYDKLRVVMQPTPVNISWSVMVNGQPAGSQMRTARLRSIYDAPIQMVTPSGPKDLSWVFAAYVTEDAPWIDKLLQEALRRGHVKQFTGYQLGPLEAARQVEAIYDELQHRGVRYSSITTSSGASTRVSSQVVRFPLDSVNNAQANCIDGTVLMASVLRKIGLDPIIILGPGHAMLGYSKTGNPKEGIIVIETTMIGTARYNDAVRAGGARFTDWSTNHRQDAQFKVISVADARRVGVTPIPR